MNTAMRVLLIGMALLSARLSAAPAPRQGFDARRPGELSRCREPDQAARLTLQCLRDEVADPTPPSESLGGRITHEYVLAQIVLAAREGKASREPLLRELAKAAPGTHRDCVQLTFGLLGEKSVVPFVIQYLDDTRKSPYLRERAARVFHYSPDRRAIPALARALKDPFRVVTVNAGAAKRYDVRITARAALLSIRTATGPPPADAQRALDQVVTTEPCQSPAPAAE